MSSPSAVPLAPATPLRCTAMWLVVASVVAEPLVLGAMIASPAFFLRGMMLQGAIIGMLALAAWLVWMPRSTLLLDTEARCIRYDRVSSRRVPFGAISRITLGGSDRSAWLTLWDGPDRTVAQVQVVANRRSSMGMPQREALADLVASASAPGIEIHGPARPQRQLHSAGSLVLRDAATQWLRDSDAITLPDALRQLRAPQGR